MHRIYKVDYVILDKAKYEAAPDKLPKYIVGDSFDSAFKAASKFETDNVVLLELALAAADGNIAIAKGFKGV